MKRISFIFFIAMLLIGCSGRELSKEEAFKKERDSKVHAALGKFKALMEKRGYRAAGLGEGVDHESGKQNYLGLTFDIEHLPDVDFARKIEVEALQEFQKCINSEDGIQDYVKEYPFPIRFIHLSFINQNRNEGLFSVSNCYEQLYYYQDPPDKPIGPSIEIHSETYEEAVHILAQQQPQVLN